MAKYLQIVIFILLLSSARSEKIRIHIDSDLGANYAGFIIADSLGFYQKYDIDIEFCKEWGRDECPNDSVITLAVMNLDKAIEYAGNGGDIVNICQISQTSSLAFISLKHKNIDSLHNLSGADIAIQRGMYKDTSHLNELLNVSANIVETQAGLELLVFDGVDVLLGSMERDYIDLYFSGFDPHELNVLKLNDLGLDLIEEGIYAKSEIIQNKPTLLKSFVKATISGWEYTRDKSALSAEMIAEYLKQHKMRANYEILDEELKHIVAHIFPKDKQHRAFQLSETDFDKVVQVLIEAGLIENKVNYHKFYKSEILDNE